MKTKLLLFSSLFIALSSFAQKNYWHSVNAGIASKINEGKAFFTDDFQPASYQLFSLKETDLAAALLQISAAKNNTIIIAVPLANGAIERFSLKESAVMAPALQAKYVNIHTYTGQGIDNASRTITCSYNKLGFFASIRTIGEKTMYLNPVNNSSKLYAVFARSDNDKSVNKLKCQTDKIVSDKLAAGNNKTAPNGNIDDGTLRTFRLALCTTGEWSRTFVSAADQTHEDSLNTVLAALAVDLARANQVYETDLGIHMNFVDDEEKIIFLDPATDPFTLFNLNSKCQQTCDNKIGNANYDIGHVVAKGGDNGNAGCIGCVCKTGSKGSGMTTYSKPLLTDYFVIDYWTHEMGHQYGANHTFTFSNEGTNAQIEPGSGSTIMGYAGITGATDVQPHSDDLFSIASIAQISNYIKPGGGGHACAVETTTGNHTPTANAGVDRVIPVSTPFLLTGSATDADKKDKLSYIWEQVDAYESGASTYPQPTTTKGPEYRAFNYNSSLQRVMPLDTTVARGATSNKWEALSAISRTLNFRFTARDNHVGGGNNKSDNMTVTVTNAAGPFKIISPNTKVSWAGGSKKTIKWNVANTAAAPVNCTSVKIALSTDGGKTFSYTLQSDAPNNGSAQVTIPDVATNNARIIILANNNIFFDVSDADFTITSAAIAATEISNDATFSPVNVFTVSPNPAKDFIHVVFNAAAKHAIITLINANGKSVLSKSLSSVTKGQTEKLLVSSLARGNYFVNIKTDTGTKSQKIIID